jgi:hypothetical protein
MIGPIVTQATILKLQAMNSDYLAMRLEDELALMGAFEMYRTSADASERAAILSGVRAIVQPLMDAAYGPVRTSWSAS